MCPDGVCWSAKAGGRLTRAGASYLIGLRAYLTFSVGYELDVGVKKKQRNWQSLTKSWPFCTNCCRNWLPGLVAAEAWVCIVLFGLVLAGLYLSSLNGFQLVYIIDHTISKGHRKFPSQSALLTSIIA